MVKKIKYTAPTLRFPDLLQEQRLEIRKNAKIQSSSRHKTQTNHSTKIQSLLNFRTHFKNLHLKKIKTDKDKN